MAQGRPRRFHSAGKAQSRPIRAMQGKRYLRLSLWRNRTDGSGSSKTLPQRRKSTKPAHSGYAGEALLEVVSVAQSVSAFGC
ncbi:hypothetical protein SRHO_G00114750 [Serrasalmus rhombeus]